MAERVRSVKEGFVRSFLGGLLVAALAGAASAEVCVVAQTSGENLTGSVCSLLERAYFAHESGVETADVTGVVLEAAWLQADERRDLPYLLAYLSQMGVRATLELPATRFNDEPIALLAAHGGAVFERESTERIGATREIARAFVEGGGGFLLLEDFTPHPSSEVTRTFEVPEGTDRVLLTVLITDPTGRVVVEGPNGTLGVPTRRSAKALQWDLSSPGVGEYRVAVKGTLRTRIYAQTPATSSPLPACVRPGSEVEAPAGRWVLTRLNDAGRAIPVASGEAGEAVRLAEAGDYALTVHLEDGTIRRRGIHAGVPRPILYRPTPSGVVAEETTVRAALLGLSPPTEETIRAELGGSPRAVTLVPCGSWRGISAVEARFEAAGLLEGSHFAVLSAEVEGEEVSDSWTFVLDRPKAGPLRISEFHVEGGWVELEALEAVSDLTRYGLTDLESGPVRLPPGALDAGERIAIQMKASPPLFASGRAMLSQSIDVGHMDQIAIVTGEGEEYAVVDAVVFRAPTDTDWSDYEREDLAFLAERGAWTGEAVELEGPFASLERTGEGNTASVWSPAFYPSPGRPSPAPVAAFSAAGDVVVSEVALWGSDAPWVEIEARNGPVDVGALSITDFDGIEERVSSSPRILQAGERLVIRWGHDEGPGDVRLTGRAPSRTVDQVGILLGKTVLDVVSWREEEATISREEAKDFADLDITPHVRPAGVPGASHVATLSRRGSDWSWAFVPSPGEENPAVSPPPTGSVRIRAVSPSEFSGDWAEVECLSGPVDVSRFVLTDLDGEDEPIAASPVTLQTGEVLVVRWEDGTDETDDVGDANGNGIREVFLSGKHQLSSTDDQLVLVWGNTIHDAVVFTNGDGTMDENEMKDLQYLIGAGAWTSSLDQTSAVNVGTYRLPIERAGGQDTNSKDDWRNRSPNL